MTGAFLSKEYFDDPYMIYRDFHANNPIFWNPDIKAWIISSYSEVEKGLSNSNLNAGERISSATSHLTLAEKEEFSKIINTLSNWIVFQDPPKHTRLRKLVNKSFTPRSIEAFRLKIENIVEIGRASCRERV